ncbi:MAG: TIGR00270 family protein [Nanoarchaeota archaeon]|nr:TIGR00270 family protein [Nanoarchaeota archaeon]
MVECEICGSAADRKAEIEGAVLNVCGSCSKFGKHLIRERTKVLNPLRLPEEAQLTMIRNFPEIIRTARMKKQLSQEQLASAIKEKLSLVKRMEESWSPPLQIARKIEKFLGIKLVESFQQDAVKKEPVKKDVTIGDVAIMKRKPGNN